MRNKRKTSARPLDLHEIVSGRIKLDNPERGGGGTATQDPPKPAATPADAARERAEARVRELIAEEVSRVIGGGGVLTNENVREVVDKAVEKHLKELQEESGRVLIPGFEEKEAKRFSISRAALGMFEARSGNPHAMERIAPYESEVFREMDKWRERTMATYSGSLGGYLIPPVVLSTVIEKLRPSSVWRQLGMRMLTGLKGPVTIPRKASVTSPDMVSEGDKGATADDITFEQIDAVPHEIMGLSKVTEKLLREGGTSVDALIVEDIMTEIDLKVDAQIFNGGLGAKDVKGLFNLTGIQTATSSGATASAIYDDMVTMIAKLKRAYITRDGSWRWLFNTDAWEVLAKLKEGTTNSPYFHFGGFAAPPLADTLAGVKWLENQQFASVSNDTQFALVKGSEQIYFEWAPMEMKVSDQNDKAFERREIHIRGLKEFDVNTRHPESIVLMSDFPV